MLRTTGVFLLLCAFALAAAPDPAADYGRHIRAVQADDAVTSLASIDVTGIERPTFFGEFTEGLPPRARIANNTGQAQNNFEVRCEILHDGSVRVYDEVVEITSQLGPGQNRWIDLPPTVPLDPGDYEAIFTTILEGGSVSGRLARGFKVADTLEAYWDNWQGSGWVSESNLDHGYGHVFPNYWNDRLLILETKLGLSRYVFKTWDPDFERYGVRIMNHAGGRPDRALYYSGSISARIDAWNFHELPIPVSVTTPYFYVAYIKTAGDWINHMTLGRVGRFYSPDWLQVQWWGAIGATWQPTDQGGDFAIRCFITVLPPSSVKEEVVEAPAQVGGLELSPNPLVGDIVTLRYNLPKAGPARMRVFDVTGRNVLSQGVPAARTGTTSLDLRGLSAGVYLVQVESDGFIATQNLVVQR